VPVAVPTASNFSTRLSFEEVVEAGYILSVDALRVLQKDGYIVLNDSDIRNALASFEIDIQASFETDDWWRTVSARYYGQLDMQKHIGKHEVILMRTAY